MANFIIIRDLCERKRITIRELASRIRKDESTIQTLIRNGSTNTTTLEKIAQVLDVPMGIFFDENIPSKISQKGGDGSAMAIYGNANAGDAQKEIEHLKQLLEEKERTIQILLMNKN